MLIRRATLRQSLRPHTLQSFSEQTQIGIVTLTARQACKISCEKMAAEPTIPLKGAKIAVELLRETYACDLATGVYLDAYPLKALDYVL